MTAPHPIHILPLPGLPEIRAGDRLAPMIAASLSNAGIPVQPGAIFVVAQKIVSKAEGRTVALNTITPSQRAAEWAAQWCKDARVVELVLSESKSILRMERGIIVSETRHGFICANAGVDASNTEENTAVLLPEDPDASAEALRSGLHNLLGIPLGVIISDTFGRAWREGLVNVALGVAGLPALIDHRGRRDGNGKLLQATIMAPADEIASAAELVMGKAARVPVAIVTGVTAEAPSGSGKDLIRPAERDLFR